MPVLFLGLVRLAPWISPVTVELFERGSSTLGQLCRQLPEINLLPQIRKLEVF